MKKIKSFKCKITEKNLADIEKKVNKFVLTHDVDDIKINTYQKNDEEGCWMIMYTLVYNDNNYFDDEDEEE